MSSEKFDLGVLLYSTGYSYEDSEHFLDVGISQAERLKAVGNRAIVLTIDSKDYSKQIGIEHIPLKIPKTKYIKHTLFLIKSFIKLSTIARKNRDKNLVFVGRSFMAGAIVSLISRIFGGSSVVYYQFDWVNWKEGIVDRTAAKITQKPSIKYSHLLIATTGSLKDTLISMGADSSKVKIVPNHVETRTFKHTDRKKARKELGIYEREKSLLFAGRFEEQKNLFTLLKAVKDQENVDLYLAGDGTQKERLKEFIEKNDMTKRVVFLGKIPQNKLVKYINACDIFVLPSFYEGHPKALIEAMACRTAIVASKTEGNEDVIEDNVNGLMANPYDVEELKNKLQLLLDDKELSRRLALKAEQDAGKYRISRIMEDERKVFSELLREDYKR